MGKFFTLLSCFLAYNFGYREALDIIFSRFIFHIPSNKLAKVFGQWLSNTRVTLFQSSTKITLTWDFFRHCYPWPNEKLASDWLNLIIYVASKWWKIAFGYFGPNCLIFRDHFYWSFRRIVSKTKFYSMLSIFTG